MKEFLKERIIRFENGFFANVIKRGLGMMIPLILVGALACALRNFPIPVYQSWINSDAGSWLGALFDNLYNGTFDIFSLTVAVAIGISYAMERNENADYMGIYLLVALGAFCVQLNIGSEHFSIEGFGVVGCFAAIVVSYLACKAFTELRKVRWLSLENFASGMGGVCVPAIQSFLPVAVILCTIALLNQLLGVTFGVYSLYELVNTYLCRMFESFDQSNVFLSGLIYTIMIHVFWFFGIHGNHILEPVMQNVYVFGENEIFSRSFYDTFVSMGGSGTTICVIIALLLFIKKDRLKKLAGIAACTGIFNINEILTFGIPIIWNPVLFLPFLTTPVVAYCISYGAMASGIVPVPIRDNAWTLPVLFSGYRATGSVRGLLLQVVCLAVGVLIYLPFLKINSRIEDMRAKEHVKILVRELQEKEEMLERPDFLMRGDQIGAISRLMLKDLKRAIRDKELYLLYQPQVSADGRCIGAEALLRWNHPIYGFIYPPLIIYLAEEGKLLPELEDFIISEVTEGIHEVQEKYKGPFKVSINLTANSLLWGVEQSIQKHLAKYQIPADKLWIEITEQDILVQTDVVGKKLNQLREMGHMLLIDDFGMGHTSLLYLQSDDFGIVKLDGSLIRTILTSKTNQKIVASIVELGQQLGVGVIAEYVETEEQKKLLEELGCTCYQGYLYSKPVPLDEFMEYLIRVNKTLDVSCCAAQ